MMVGSVNLFRCSLLLVGLVWWTVKSVGALGLSEICTNPEGEPMKCFPSADRKSLLNIYNKLSKAPEDIKLLLQSRCGVFQQKNKSSLPEAPNCGVLLPDRIPDGLDEFPWSALVEIQKPNGSFGFFCGGSLINKRYIVTAAHCFKSLPEDWIVHHVRLGERDLTSSKGCEDSSCTDAPINVEVEKIVVHPDYVIQGRIHRNDIALIRFAREIQYSHTIRPICLPLHSMNYSHKDMVMHAIGWGKAETASVGPRKLKVELNVVDLKECAHIYQRFGVTLLSTQICASAARPMDTCSGDSGGPLMHQITGSWYQIGVASPGPGKCGMTGVPEIYTNVTEYVDWIRNNIE